MFGYYFTVGSRFGGSQSECKDWTNGDVYMWRQFDLNGIEEGLYELRQAVKWSVKRNRSISLELDRGYLEGSPYQDSWKRQIKRSAKRFWSMPLTDPWNSVKLIEVADEPSPQQARIWTGEVKKFLEEQGLERDGQLVGATFSYKLTTTKPISADLDFVGLEAYLDTDYQWDVDSIYSRIYRQLGIQGGMLLHPYHKVVVVLQAYNRTGNWTKLNSLRELQWRGYEAAKKLFGDRLVGIKMFSWRRSGGTFDIPELRVEHQKIWADIQSKG